MTGEETNHPNLVSISNQVEDVVDIPVEERSVPTFRPRTSENVAPKMVKQVFSLIRC